MHLDKNDRAILGALGEDGGFTTGDVAKRANIRYGTNARQRSAAVRSWLTQLKRAGLVEFLDDQKPTCWRRTQAGTVALNTAQ